MDATSGTENACPSGASEFILVFSETRILSIDVHEKINLIYER
jgi:hypothetical protein